MSGVNLPESHVDVAPLGSTSENAVEPQRRVLEHTDVRVLSTLGSGKETMPGMSLNK